MKLTKTIITTSDGSKTIAIKEWNEHYHSTHGAIQESKHVYIDAGLNAIGNNISPVRILEFGFGTGLNALLTFQHAEQNNLPVEYHSIEAFPVDKNLIEQLDYPEKLDLPRTVFNKMHQTPFYENIKLTGNFSLYKIKQKFEDFHPKETYYNLVYFDVFGARVQPELWQPAILQKAYQALTKNGIFVTYAAKGQLKRDLKVLGFTIETLSGPPGKREMIRAVKI